MDRAVVQPGGRAVVEVEVEVEVGACSDHPDGLAGLREFGRRR